jgi:hypothetical protein
MRCLTENVGTAIWQNRIVKQEKSLNMESEGCALLAAATKQRLLKTNWEGFSRIVVKCKIIQIRENTVTTCS